MIQEESGFASGQTFSFDETEGEIDALDGIRKVLKQDEEKKENVLDDEIFHVHVLERKVNKECYTASELKFILE